MILVDANLLLYAYHAGAPQHAASRAWLESALAGRDLIGFAWLTIWAFLRISTNPRVFHEPLTAAEAAAAVSAWLDQPATRLVEPGERHWEILERLMREGQAVGPLLTDAALAALAIEQGATLYTTDRDFARFPGLRWVNPIDAAR